MATRAAAHPLDHLLWGQDSFDGPAAAGWFLENVHIPAYGSLAYLACLVLLPRLMADRKPMKLYTFTLWWNIALTVFSMLGAINTMPTLVRVLSTRGFRYSCCADVFEMVGGGGRGAPYAWAALFVLSKLFEYGDTVLLMLKKKEVIFLHGFHHVSVGLIAWYGCGKNAPVAMWCGTMNYTVHSFMYLYYSAMAAPAARPLAKPFAGLITLLQISQMVMATVIHLAIVYWHVTGAEGAGCWWDPPVLLCTLGAYIVYLVLFAKIFVERYMMKPAEKRATNAAANGRAKSNGHTKSNGHSKAE